MCALGTVAEGVLVAMGARRSAGEGAMEMEFQVHGPGSTVFGLNLQNDVELFYPGTINHIRSCF